MRGGVLCGWGDRFNWQKVTPPADVIRYHMDNRTYPSTAGHPRIAIDPAIMVGKPCVVGTRITVQLLLNKLAAGWSIAEVTENYPQISSDDVAAAISFAAIAMGPSRTLEAAE